MKYNLKMGSLALAVAAGSMLAGCEQGEYVDVNALDVEDVKTVDAQARDFANKETAELKQALAEAQAKDPSIKDMYYSVDAAGEKVLNVVREGADKVQQTDSWPMVQGMLLGMMMGQMMSHPGGYGGYRSSYAPRTSYSGSYEQERRRKNVASAGYMTHVRNTTTRTYKSSPSFQSKVSARSSRVFASSSSARSGGYSNGG